MVYGSGMRRIVPIAVLALAVLTACSDDGGSRSADDLLVDVDATAAEQTTTTEEPEEPEETTTTTGAVEAEGEVCEVFQEIADSDDRFQAELETVLTPLVTAAASGDAAAAEAAFEDFLAAMQPLLESEVPALLDAYDRLAAAAPDLAGDVVLVRDFTQQITEDLVTAASADEAFTAVQEASGAEGIAAGEATLRLDQASQERCGIVLAD